MYCNPTSLNKNGHKICRATVGLINKVFADGQAGREQPNIKGDFIASCKNDGKTDMLNDQNVLHIIASASWWCNQAYMAGQEAAHHE